MKLFATILGIGFSAVVGVGVFYRSNVLQTRQQTPVVRQKNADQRAVLAAQTVNEGLAFNVIVPATFGEKVTFEKNVEIKGNVISSNLVQKLIAGSGISIKDTTTPTITNSGVTSLQSKTGALSLTAGTGITIDGLKITTSAKLSDIRSNGGCSSCITDDDVAAGLTISGGSIDNSPIGGATPSTGAFTTLAASSTLAVTGATTFSSTLAVIGATTLTGNVSFGGQVVSDIVPSSDATYALGSSSKQWSKLYLSGVATIGGQSTFTSAPTGTGVGNGVIYINPASVADTSYTLFGIAVGGTEKLRMDASGNITVQGNLVGPQGGSVGYWSRSGTSILPATSNDIVSYSSNNTTNAFAVTATAASANAFNLTADSVTTGNGLSVSVDGLTTGNGMSLASTSTAGGVSGASYLLNLSRSGANANASHTAYGLYSTVTNTNATSGTNTAAYLSASGATTANYAIYSAAGQNYFLSNGAASTPVMTLAGTWFTGGSATTTKPQLLIEPTGTTSTGWSTSGTGLGVNAATGFAGNLIDAQIAGTSKFSVNTTGTRINGVLAFNGAPDASLGSSLQNINGGWGLTGQVIPFFDRNGIRGTGFGFGGNYADPSNTGFIMFAAPPNNQTSEFPYVKHQPMAFSIGAGFASQRFTLFVQPTITAASALNISSEATTLSISGAPISAGSATIANAYGLKIDSGTSVAAGVTNAYGLSVSAPTGATNNYAATFATGNVGIGTTSPVAGLENATAGAASKANTLLSGTWFTGGTSTTTKPQLLVEPTGTASTGWSTSGTGIGVNSASTFAGNLLDLGQVGNSTFKVAGVSSGVNGFTFTTGATGSGVNMSATGTDTNIALTLDSKGTGAINLGTGASAKTITIGNNTGATALALTSGTGSQTFTSSNATGATTASSWVFNDAALTTGTGAYFTSATLTTGKLVDISNTSNTQTTGTMFNISSTATSLTTGSLATLDWSPGSVQATAATGNLFNINIGANATNFAGNLFNVADASSSIFAVSKTAVTSALPFSITAPGDASFAYDIQMTNPTSSFIKSSAPLTIQAGEVFNSSNLTLKTYNQGSVVVDSSVTTGTGVDFTNNTLTTGTGLYVAANALTTGNAVNIVSTSTAGGASGASYLLNLSRSGANANLAHTAYGIYSTVTNTNATSGTNTAAYLSASGATTANYAIYSAAGQNYFLSNGAASTPVMTLAGTWFTSGTATTTKPQLLIEPTGTTSTGWSTSGTGLGVNAATGFAGNIVDFQLTGTSKFKIDQNGNVFLSNNLVIGGNGQGLNFAGLSNTGVHFTTAANTPRTYFDFSPITMTAESPYVKVNTATAETVSTSYTNQRFTQFAQPLLSINSGITITNAATTYIEGAPSNAGLGSITNNYALWVDAGASRFDGGINVGGNTTVSTAGDVLGVFAIKAVAGNNLYIGEGSAAVNVNGVNLQMGGGTILPSAPNNLVIKNTADNNGRGKIQSFAYTTLASEIVPWSVEAATQTITGSYTTQRFWNFEQPTITAATALTVTDAATLAIAGAPIKAGSAVLTNTHGLLIQAGAVSTATNSYGLTVNAQTGATNNYAAAFLGGNVGIGTTTPAGKLDVNGALAVGGASYLTYAGSSIWDAAGTTRFGSGVYSALYSSAVGTQLQIQGGGVSNNNTININPPIYPGTAEASAITTTPAQATNVSGNITTQRLYRFNALTLNADATPRTITNASNLYVSGPITTGTNLSVTNSYSLRIDSGSAGSGTTNAYGLYVDAPTAATNNYAATFATGNVGIGTTGPNSKLDIYNSQGSGYIDVIRISADKSNPLSTGNGIVWFASTNDNTNVYNAGRIIGTFDANAYSAGRITLQYPTGAGTFSDGLSLKNGNVGIGTVNPQFRLDVTDSPAATFSAMITNSNTGASSKVLALKSSATTPGTGNYFAAFLGGNGDILGKIRGNGTTTSVTYDTAGGDFAEYFRKEHADEEMGDGDLLCFGSTGGVTKCKDTMTGRITGVFSSNAGFVGNNRNHDNDKNYVLVGLVGQLNVKVATDSAVLPGDYLTVSASSGSTEIAKTAGEVVGKALEGKNCTNNQLFCTVRTLVNVSWYDPNSKLTMAAQNLLSSSSSAIMSSFSSSKDLNLDGNALVGKNLMVLGRTTVTDLGITGNMIAGLVSIHGLTGEVNTLSGNLKLQSQSLGGIDILNGKITMDTKGNLKTVGEITAKKINVTKDSANIATLPKGQTSMYITNSLADKDSIITITPRVLLNKPLVVTNQQSGGFTVEIAGPEDKDIQFSYLIIGVK